MENLISKNAEMRWNIFSVTFLAEKIRGKEGRFLFGLALIARIIAFPFASLIEADAGARLFLADHAWHHGGELYSYQWPSLHIYFLSFFQMITGERVLGPKILDLLLGAGVVVPFYRFTKNVFNKQGAFYAALIFTFCPLVFRSSFSSLSEIYNVFFTVTALWCLSEGLLHPEKKIRWALFAGLSLTIACGGRLEAWVFAVLLGVILLLHRQWKMFFVFGTASALFPVSWLLICYLKRDDAFISVHMVQNQNLIIGNINAALQFRAEWIRRIFFFPFSWFIVVTPIAAFIIIRMMIRVCRHFKTRRTQALFLLLFLFWILLFFYETIAGLRATQHRFTLILVFLSMPFYALWFERSGKMRAKKIISIAIAVLIIPWSFYWEYVPWHKLAFGSQAIQKAISETIPATYAETQAIPIIQSPVFSLISDSINSNLQKDDGLFIDYCDWNPTAFLAARTRLPMSAIYQAYDYVPHHGDHGYMPKFFEKHPKGQIVLSDFSTLVPEAHFHGPLLEFDSVPGGFLLKPIINNQHYRLFRYVYINAEETEIQRQNFNLAEPLFRIEKDVEFYVILNYHDGAWLADTWIKALGEFKSIDAQVHDNAKWVIEQNELKNKQENKPDSIPQ